MRRPCRRETGAAAEGEEGAPLSRLDPLFNSSLLHKGPPLDRGPLPSVFYFALSAEDSLNLDPFNQPVQRLLEKEIRCFSMTLPGHENNLPATKALEVWANDISRLTDFFDEAAQTIDRAIQEGFADPAKTSAMGLSRGGFAAAHIAARCENIQSLLCFAPVTQLKLAKEFSHLQEDEAILSLDLEHLSEKLLRKKTRIYIGNHDTRVDTKSAIDWAMNLVDAAVKHKLRSPQIDLILYPSIGLAGHGTPPEIFEAGADWIGN